MFFIIACASPCGPQGTHYQLWLDVSGWAAHCCTALQWSRMSANSDPWWSHLGEKAAHPKLHRHTSLKGACCIRVVLNKAVV